MEHPAQTHDIGWRRRILRVAAPVVLGGVALLVVVALWRNAVTAAHELETTLATLDATEPGWRMNQIQAARPVVPDEQNSCVVIGALMRVPTNADLENEFWHHGLPSGAIDSRSNRLLHGCHLDRLSTLQDHPALPLARSLKDYPQGRAPLTFGSNFDNTLTPHIDGCRKAMVLLHVDLEWQLHENRAHAAAERIEALLNIAAALRDEPLWHSQMMRGIFRRWAVRATSRWLALTEPADADLARLQVRFRSEASENLTLVALRGDRARAHDVLDAWGNRVTPPLSSRHRAMVHTGHAWVLKWYTQAIELASAPVEQQQGRWGRLADDFARARMPEAPEDRSFGEMIGAFYLPGGLSLDDHHHLTLAETALACERSRKANGRWPNAPPLPAGTILLKAQEEGILLSSGRQDGRGNPIEFRLYDPERRRLPPEEP